LPKGSKLMSTEFFIPKLGQTVEEVTIVKWLVPDGTRVTQGQEIIEVETDKAVFPVEANGKGYLHIGPFKEGQVVPVLTVVALIGSPEEKYVPGAATVGVGEGEETSTSPVEETYEALTSSTQAPEKTFVSPRARKLADARSVDLSRVTPSGGGGVRIAERDVLAFLDRAVSEPEVKAIPRATPIAQRVAAAAGVDLQQVTGTGPGGTIRREDVERSLKPEPAMPQPATGTATDILERVPLKGVRAIIADRMGTSVHTTARVTLIMEVDATRLVEARSRIKERVEKDWGFAPGYNDLLAKFVAHSLRKYPYMNARLSGDAIERMAHINLGMAVDTERGLLVPVILDADQKSLRVFGDDFRKKVERARLGRSLPDDLSGSTFTITNLGMYDVDAFTPVINLPEAAILGVGRIAAKPVVRGESIEVRQMLVLSLVFDHRLIDGAPAARFLQYIKQVIEEPYLLLAE
jgi:pyruvate dehydrogenase E2 component (dihydrolipoamide acetyltransferase)